MRQLPPNPFARAAIEDRRRLAARSEELDQIKYYLNLSAQGTSQHLAMVGGRGVGKTSLLNAAHSTATEGNLVVVRFDLDEGKTTSAPRFWHELYMGVLMSAFESGIWDGPQGKIFESIFSMIYGKQPASTENAVLYVPAQLASSQLPNEEIVIAQALLVRDFNKMAEQLEKVKKRGFVILIDEADCLQHNPVILQELRNVLQRCPRFTLYLAGTQGLFPLISEVFSPIPRQFFKIEVSPFSHWTATNELISTALEDVELPLPSIETVQELHQLCGGDPSELKLYCHHIYKAIECGELTTFKLSPQVIRRVLDEFRAGATGAVLRDISLIDSLDQQYLVSRYLMFRQLTAKETAELIIFGTELANRRPMDEAARLKLESAVLQQFSYLHDQGLSEASDCLRFAGDPMSSAYWKSKARSVSNPIFNWVQTTRDSVFWTVFVTTLSKGLNLVSYTSRQSKEFDSNALHMFRSTGRTTGASSSDVRSLIESTVKGRADRCTQATDLQFKSSLQGAEQWHQVTVLVSAESVGVVDQIKSVVDECSEILSSHEYSVELIGFKAWTLPTNLEMHRLGRAARVHVPEEIFGPDRQDQAISLYKDGKVDEAIGLFEELIQDLDDPSPRNNLAFLLLLRGDLQGARVHLEAATAKVREPLFMHNLAILCYLEGNDVAAASLMQEAHALLLEQSHNVGGEGTIAMLVIKRGTRNIGTVCDVQMDVGFALNMSVLGLITAEQAEEKLNLMGFKGDLGLFEFEDGSM